jgi:hypothetical protein
VLPALADWRGIGLIGRVEHLAFDDGEPVG